MKIMPKFCSHWAQWMLCCVVRRRFTVVSAPELTKAFFFPPVLFCFEFMVWADGVNWFVFQNWVPCIHGCVMSSNWSGTSWISKLVGYNSTSPWFACSTIRSTKDVLKVVVPRAWIASRIEEDLVGRIGENDSWLNGSSTKRQ